MKKPNNKSSTKKEKKNFVDYTKNTVDELIDITKNIKENINEKSKDDPLKYNKLSFSQALLEDKRSFFRIYINFIFIKIDLFSLFICGNLFKSILICQYLLSLLLDFFFNTLFYSDDIVSHKYHNNGNLDYIVTFGLSIASNIIIAIITHFIEVTNILEERLELVHEIRKEYKYLYASNKYLKFIKFKIICFIFTEIIIIAGCFYYIIIFYIVYSKSQKSLFINYLISLVESLIKSIIISSIIAITRKIVIGCNNSYIYNTSKFIDDNF